MTTKHLKVSILDSEEFTEESVVELRDVDETHIPMALMRAVAALCVTAGLPTPTQELQRVSVGTADTAQLAERLAEQLAEGEEEDRPESTLPLNDRAELERIDRVLLAHGADYGGVRGVLDLIQKQAEAALPAYKLANAIGPRFVETLALVREAHRAVALADSDSKSLTIPSGDYQRALTVLYGATGRLLNELRKIEPEDRPAPGGGTTVTLTEAVDLSQIAKSS